jgi:protein involved in polysaccharide export with SLBB domain
MLARAKIILVVLAIASVSAAQDRGRRLMQTFSLFGQGAQGPGLYPLREGMHLADALRGELREDANIKDIIVVRGKQRLHLNYQDYLQGKNREANIVLRNEDRIFVRSISISKPP